MVYVSAPELSWGAVDGSAGYWLEISSDQNFERIVENAFGIGGTDHAAKPLAAGDYFWRVSALDGFGLPGQRSETWRFRVTPDDAAPFLRIDRPTRDAIFRKASIDVSGESEPGADVTVNAGTIEVGEGGAFRATIEARRARTPSSRRPTRRQRHTDERLRHMRTDSRRRLRSGHPASRRRTSSPTATSFPLPARRPRTRRSRSAPATPCGRRRSAMRPASSGSTFRSPAPTRCSPSP
jgi:hypothetical protein